MVLDSKTGLQKSLHTFTSRYQFVHKAQNRNLYNNFAKPFSTVCTDPFYGLTSGPRPPRFSQADPKLDVKSRLPKKIEKKIEKKISRKNFEFFEIFSLNFFLNFFMKTRSVAEHSASVFNCGESLN
jgi:hypothetical protein